MDHHGDVACVFAEGRVHGRGVADVGVDMGIAALAAERLDLPAGAGLLAEELAAHVVIDADDLQTSLSKHPCGLGANQTGNDRHAHAHILWPLRRQE